jgi:hypothetical protein
LTKSTDYEEATMSEGLRYAIWITLWVWAVGGAALGLAGKLLWALP